MILAKGIETKINIIDRQRGREVEMMPNDLKKKEAARRKAGRKEKEREV